MDLREKSNSQFYRKRRHPKKLQSVGYYVTESLVINCNRCRNHNRGNCNLHNSSVELQGRCPDWKPRYNEVWNPNYDQPLISEPYSVGVISMSGIPYG